MNGPIINASSMTLSQNTGQLPQMTDALDNWLIPMIFTKVGKVVDNYVVKETPTNVNFQGVWQQFSDRELMLKPIGERDWSWFMVHADPSLILMPDEVITYQATQYRVMAQRDYKEYGYVEYHLIEDYTGSGPNP